MVTATEKKQAPPAKTGQISQRTETASPPPAKERTIVDIVADKIRGFVASNQLDLPKDYSPDNALKSAWLALQAVEDKDHRPALAVCTKESVANSLLDMIVQGLNPGKKQGYFIVYGNKLIFQRSYFGAMAVAQMVNQKIGEFAYAVVYEGDEFKYGIQNGKKTVTLHEQDIKNVHKDRIAAAYCIVLDKAGEPMKTEIMTIDEIMQSWKKSKTAYDDNGNLRASSTHAQFTADMALRTVINKACKIIINASSDNALLLERINRSEDLADAAAVQAEIMEKANTGSVVMLPAETDTVVPGETQKPEEKPAEAACLCDQFIKEKAKEWDCPIHGRYKKGTFTKNLFDERPGRNPGF